MIGESAGLSACSSLIISAAVLSTPSCSTGGLLDSSVQRACNSLAGSSCVIYGRQLAMMHPICNEILAGAGSCPLAEAAENFEESLAFVCEPLCPDCKGDE